MTERWHVVYCHARKEFVAKEHLLNQSFDVYVPSFKKLVRHAGSMREVVAPLFPRYLFVRFDSDMDLWRSIRYTRGVINLIAHKDGTLQYLSNSIIQGIRASEDNDGLVSLAALDHFKAGDDVRILEGVFKGHIAKYQKMTDQQRVEILINFLNKDVLLQMPTHAVEKAA